MNQLFKWMLIRLTGTDATLKGYIVYKSGRRVFKTFTISSTAKTFKEFVEALPVTWDDEMVEFIVTSVTNGVAYNFSGAYSGGAASGFAAPTASDETTIPAGSYGSIGGIPVGEL